MGRASSYQQQHHAKHYFFMDTHSFRVGTGIVHFAHHGHGKTPFGRCSEHGNFFVQSIRDRESYKDELSQADLDAK